MSAPRVLTPPTAVALEGMILKVPIVPVSLALLWRLPLIVGKGLHRGIDIVGIGLLPRGMIAILLGVALAAALLPPAEILMAL